MSPKLIGRVEVFDVDNVTVIDSICGSGKTSWAMRHMQAHTELGKRFIYITPFLDEVKRVKLEGGFKEPVRQDGKLNSLKNLLIRYENIASTHALFKKADNEIIDLLQMGDYTLILDEVMDCVEHLPISKSDVSILIREWFINLNDDGTVSTNDTEYKGKFTELLEIIKHGSVVYTRSGDAVILLLWMFPVEIFQSFTSVYVLTYMFEGTTMSNYFKLNGVEYSLKSCEESASTCRLGYAEKRWELINHRADDGPQFKDLINICQDETLNVLGKRRGSLSVTWYGNASSAVKGKLKRAIYTYIRKRVCAKSSEILWTTFKDYRKHITGNGYGRGFAAHNLRATNIHRDRSVVVYTVNRYLNPYLVTFFKDVGNIDVSQDEFALNELVQFLFRSRLRNREPIQLYIPSKRMRELLEGWLDGV